MERLRVVIVEDVEVDAELAARELRRAGIVCDVRRVATADQYESALKDFQPHVILSDFSMPGFDGMEALAIARRLAPDIPFVFVSGTLGEEYAIRALKNGASDYVLKTNLVRLPAAVERALEQAKERGARQRLERDLQESERRYRKLFEGNPHPMWVYDTETLRFLAVNDRAVAFYGYTREEFLSMTIKDIRPIKDVDRLMALVEGGVPKVSESGQWRHRKKNGELIDVEVTSHAFGFEGRPARLVVAYDITERKRAEERLLESEAKYRGLIEQASDGILLTDLEGNFVMANTRACELLRCAQSDLLQMRGSDTYLAEDAESYAERKKRVRAGEDLRYERMVRRKDGTAFPAEVGIKMLDNRLIQVIFHDITNRRAQEQKIARLSRIQAVLSGINSAIVRIRNRQELFHETCRIIVERGGFTVGWIGVLDQGSGKLAPVAQAGLPIDFGSGGESSGALTPAGVAEVALREKRPAFDNRMDDSDSVNAGQDTRRVRQAAIRLGARSVIVLPLFVEGKTFGVLTLYASEQDFFDDEEIKLLRELAGDISFGLEFIAKEEKVDYLAYYDALTGLPNRALFFDRLGQQLAAARRERLDVALLLLDLDRFRMINDTLGRQAGDALLKELAQRIRSVIRDQDTVARLGPDSFAVAASGRWQMADLAHVLDARNEAIFDRPFLLGEEELRVSATAGIAMFPGDGGDPESLLTNAEAALLEAKEQSAPFLFYSPEMNARVSESLRLENRLRRALERSEMVLWYQPKVSGKTRRVTGLEALIRWNDPETGMVPPARFIPLMEQTGLILDAGRWVMSQVARDSAQWTSKGLRVPRVAVNVSSIQLRQSDFVEMVVEAAQKTQEAGGALDLEITESVFMENLEDTTRKLRIVRDLGVNIAVDDFGTGYSSLAYIARLPIHELKIDRGFVVGMTEQQESLAIVKAIISLAHSLKLLVVAEGVETDEQAEQLEQLGCDQLQGYLFGRPAPLEEVSHLLQ
jgi:diguanylate cyclase (GGDEF)-like protein/PAS domain S-box-containing protein